MSALLYKIFGENSLKKYPPGCYGECAVFKCCRRGAPEPRPLSPVFDYVLRVLQQQSASGDKYLALQNPPQFRGLFFYYPCTPSSLYPSPPFISITDRFSTSPPPPPPPPHHPRLLTFPLRDSERSLRAEVRHHHRQHHHHPAVWPHRRRVRVDATIRATLPTVGVLRRCPPATLAPSPSLRFFLPSPPANERASPRLPPPL